MNFPIVKSSALVAAFAALTAGGAVAQGGSDAAEPAWYVSGFIGAAYPGDIDTDVVTLQGIDTVVDTELGFEFDTEVTFGGAIGRKLGFKVFDVIQPRAEVEVSYFSTNVSSIDGINDDILDDLDDVGTLDDLTLDQLLDEIGDIDVLFILGNSYADFVWQEDQPIVPYIGGGLGVAVIDIDAAGSDTNFAGTTAAGLTVPVGQLDLYGEARYFRVYSSGPDFDGFTTTVGARLKF